MVVVVEPGRLDTTGFAGGVCVSVTVVVLWRVRVRVRGVRVVVRVARVVGRVKSPVSVVVMADEALPVVVEGTGWISVLEGDGATEMVVTLGRCVVVVSVVMVMLKLNVMEMDDLGIPVPVRVGLCLVLGLMTVLIIVPLDAAVDDDSATGVLVWKVVDGIPT